MPALPAGAEGVRGNEESVVAARMLLEDAGGAAAWRKPIFEVAELGYLNSGETAKISVVRDLSRPARRFESVRPSTTIVEWVSPEGGWVRRNGVERLMPPEELAAELQGLRQEPYTIYHRLANDDPGLRVELRDNRTLYVFDEDERLLCWFQIAPNSVVLGWGNFYDGAINQGWYGPSADMGDANLPRFGVQSGGAFRFEYLSARLREGKLEPDASADAASGSAPSSP